VKASLIVAGTAIVLAGAADLVWTVNDRFRADLADLSVI